MIFRAWPSFISASLISLSLVVCSADAHESHEAQMQHLEDKLSQLPSSSTGESVELVLRRADLHRRQRDWGAAVNDYQYVADKEPENIVMMLGRVQLHLDQHEYALAVPWVTRVRRLQPGHQLADIQYARALAGMGETDAASIAFDHAIKRLDKPRPELYIEHAQMLLEGKRNPGSEQKAVAILDRGGEALGHPVSLHSLAVQIEQKSGQLDAALNRTDRVLARNASLLNWRLQRGELLAKLGRPAEALDEMRCVLDKIRQLPEQRRRSRAFQAMRQRSQNLVTRLNTISFASASSSKVALAHKC